MASDDRERREEDTPESPDPSADEADAADTPDTAEEADAAEEPEVVDAPKRKKRKKDKKEESEGYKFEVPDFDEDAFIHKELMGFRTTAILFVWGIVAALLSWGLFHSMDGSQSAWYGGLLIMAALGAGLKWLYPLLGADIGHFKRKEWLGTGFLYFFTWLAVFILLVNPPISDFAEPEITVYTSPPFQQEGGPIQLDIFDADNDRINDRMFALTRGNTTIADHDDLQPGIGDGHFRYDATGLQAGTYDYQVRATDATGHTATTQGSFRISSRAITVDLPEGDILDDRTDILLVSFLEDTDFAQVRLDLEESSDPVYLEKDEEFGGWKATANYAGWQEGTNTFTVQALPQNTYHGQTLVPGGQITTGPITLEVTAQTGDYQPDYEELDTTPPVRTVPGVGIVVLAVGLIGLAAMLRRK